MVALGCPTFAVDLPHSRAFGRIGSVVKLMRPYDLVHFHAAEPLFLLASLRCSVRSASIRSEAGSRLATR